MGINLRTGLYYGNFNSSLPEQGERFASETEGVDGIKNIAINVAEVEDTKSKKYSVVFNMFADEAFGSVSEANEAVGSDSKAVDGNCVVQGKSIICTVEKIENCPLEKINNKDCLCVVFKEKTRGIPGNTYGSAIIQLNGAGELTEGEYWTNGGTCGVITDLKLQE